MIKKWTVGAAAVALVALALALGSPAASGVPSVPAGPVGSAVTITGTYLEVHGDSKYADQTLYVLKTAGRQYQLKTRGEPDLPSPSKVTVRGRVSGDLIDASAPGAITALGPAMIRPSIVGTQSVLVINVLWPGSTLTATTAQEQNFMFGTDSRTVASFYTDASYGQLTWTGTETPNLTITDPAGCNLSTLANEAEAAATSAGYVPSSYRALMINAPNLYCGAAGYGEIGGAHTWVQDGLWNLNDGYARLVPTHEIGHSLGLYHSHGLECGSVTISSACLSNPLGNKEEYGNAWDVMGNNWPGDGADAVTWFSAKQEILLGWLTGSRVRTLTTSGTYSLVPLEKSPTSSPQVLVLTTAAHTYYVEYRQPISQDAFMSAYPAATNAVHVNVSAAAGSDTGPFALDFAPNSDSRPGYYDWYDAPLPVGASFTDPEHTFTISPVSQNGTTASLSVTFLAAGTTYEEASATLSGWAPTSQGSASFRVSGVVGATAQFTFTGKSVKWLTRKGPDQGKASVTIDGLDQGTLDNYAAAASSATRSFSGLAAGSHTIVITATGAKRAAATAANVTLDGFTVGSTTTQESAPTVLFGAWKGVSNASASGGSYRSSATSGQSASFSFTGTGVDWITVTGTAWGIAEVVIDGVDRGPVDLYAATTRYQRAIAYSGLAAGPHTITVTALGSRNAAATAATVAVDAFVVH